MHSVMTELTKSLLRSGDQLGLTLGDAAHRDVTDVAAAVGLMLERNRSGYLWLLPLVVAFNDAAALPPVNCAQCEQGVPHPRHQFDGCTCADDGDGHHRVACDLFGRRRGYDDQLLVLGTSNGVELTGELLDRLAEEAEAGYDPNTLRPPRLPGLTLGATLRPAHLGMRPLPWR